MTTFTQQNLRSRNNYEECRSLICGENIPFYLRLPMTRRCAMRGIRYHPGFGKKLHGLRPEFTGALNARSIMSNEIPDMKGRHVFPSCIWHPEIAAEETCRKLAHRYPEKKYQVGRACAVAGYFNLYKKPELLPDVHISEIPYGSFRSARFIMNTDLSRNAHLPRIQPFFPPLLHLVSNFSQSIRMLNENWPSGPVEPIHQTCRGMSLHRDELQIHLRQDKCRPRPLSPQRSPGQHKPPLPPRPRA